MSIRSRVAFASGAAGAVGAGLILSGRYEASLILAAFLVYAIRTAAAATLEGPTAAGLRDRALLAPVWTLAVVGAAVRAGSTDLIGVRGANAVAGLALAHGPALTVVGAWLLFGAAVLAVATNRLERPVPEQVERLDALGMLAEVVLVVTLFAGPQISAAGDAVWWVAGAIVLLAVGFAARRGVPVPSSPVLRIAIATAGFALVLIGGAP